MITHYLMVLVVSFKLRRETRHTKGHAENRVEKYPFLIQFTKDQNKLNKFNRNRDWKPILLHV